MFSNNGKISCHQFKALIFSDFAGIYMVYLPIVLFAGGVEGVFLAYLISFIAGAALICLFSYIKFKGGKRVTKITKNGII